MGKGKLYNLKQILITITWLLIGTGTMVLLVAAAIKKNTKECSGIEINISGVSDNFFVDKNDVQKIITIYAGYDAIGKPIENISLSQIETALENNIWIKNAELFFDNNNKLFVSIDERQPIARIFTNLGNSFYIDSSMMMLPLSEKFSARLPLFTGFPADATILSKEDSILLGNIKKVSLLIQQSDFLAAMIDQIDITPQRYFEMIPKIGNQLILFGDGVDAEQKLEKLQLFYKNIMPKAGWQRYSIINLQFNGQVIAKIKGADDIVSDSLRTVQIMQAIAENAEKLASDSSQTFAPDTEKNTTDSSLILQSLERNEEGTGNGQGVMGNGQQAMGNGQQVMGNGQQAIGNGQQAKGKVSSDTVKAAKQQVPIETQKPKIKKVETTIPTVKPKIKKPETKNPNEY